MNKENCKKIYKTVMLIIVVSLITFILTTVVMYNKFSSLSDKNTVASGNAKLNSKINSITKVLERDYLGEIDEEELVEGAIKGYVDGLDDEYTEYFTKEEMEEFKTETEGNYVGIGIYMMQNTKDNNIVVLAPIKGSPAESAGIKSGDFIIAIEGESTEEMSMDQVLDKLRGEVGTPVTITILRGKTMKYDVTLVRELIEVPTVKYSMIENTSIGYVRLIKFTPDTSSCLQTALDDFASKNYKGLIIDLRDNPGGLISSVVDIADKFIDKGTIVTTKSRLAFENFEYTASEDTKVPADLPIVILINRGSASASEILSGCLKDYHRAYLVGERTYGKGSVQQVIPLSDIDGIKLTMARYYTPSDVNIDKIGIPPDLEIKNLEEFSETEEKAYLDLITSNIISKTIEENPLMSESQIADKAIEINKTYPIGERLVRRLLRNERNRTEEAPVYDLDYDLQLLQAIKNVSQPDFSELVRNTKTLKELQDLVQTEESK